MIVTRAKPTLKNGLPNTLNMLKSHPMHLHRVTEFSHIRQQIKEDYNYAWIRLEEHL